MIQAIGLIVAVYASVRLIQVPIEFSRGIDKWLGMSPSIRAIIIACISAGGLLTIGVLTLALLASSLDMPRR